jgi:TPR repeat protein
VNVRAAAQAIVMSAVALVCSAHAGDYEDGMAAYRARDYQRARLLWTPLAMQGQRRAQVSLARMCERGEGATPDLGEALRWYREAAEQNHSESQYRVAMAHAYGLGGWFKDQGQAAVWLERAAGNGHKRSQRMLAQAYRTGELGLTPDPDRAKYWQARADAKASAKAKRR